MSMVTNDAFCRMAREGVRVEALRWGGRLLAVVAAAIVLLSAW